MERSERTGPQEKKDGHGLLPLPNLISLRFAGSMAEVSHLERYKEKNGSGWFSSRRFFLGQEIFPESVFPESTVGLRTLTCPFS